MPDGSGGKELTRRGFLKGLSKWGGAGVLAGTGLGELAEKASAASVPAQGTPEVYKNREAVRVSQIPSSDPGGVNNFAEASLADPNINVIDKLKFQTFVADALKATETDSDLLVSNRSLNQLIRPLTSGEIRVRQLDFDVPFGEKQRGLGFEGADFKEACSGLNEMTVDSRMSRGVDGMFRKIVIIPNGKSVLEGMSAMADSMALEMKEDVEGAVSRFEQIFDDSGMFDVKPGKQEGQVDGFSVRETYLSEEKRSDGQKFERLQVVVWREMKPDEGQVWGDRKVENALMLVGVLDSTSGLQRTEVLSLSSTQDILNPEWDKLAQQVLGDNERSCDMGRWLPVEGLNEEPENNHDVPKGPEIPEVPKTPQTPKPPKKDRPIKPKHPNQGRGNGPEGADPGHSDFRNNSNDENGQTPGDKEPRSTVEDTSGVTTPPPPGQSGEHENNGKHKGNN